MNTNQLSQELGQRVRDDAAFPSTFTRRESPNPNLSAEDFIFQPSRDWVATMVTMVLSLIFVLLLIYLLANVYNRFLSGRFSALQGRGKIKVVSSYHVAPKQKIIVLEIEDEFFACGVSPTAINLISKLKDSDDKSFLDSIQPETPKENIDINRSRVEFMRALEKAREHAKTLAPEIAESEKFPLESAEKTSNKENLTNTKKIKKKSNSTEIQNENTPALKNFSTPVKNPFNVSIGDESSDVTLNPAIQDFAKKLSQKLKSLKPIK